MNTVQNFKELVESGNKTELHKYLGIKHYQNIDDFGEDYFKGNSKWR